MQSNFFTEMSWGAEKSTCAGLFMKASDLVKCTLTENSARFIKRHSITILALRRFRMSVGCVTLLACGLATVSAADCGGTGSVVCSRQGGASAAQDRTWQDAERARQQAALAKEEARLNKESNDRRKIQEMQTERERQDKVNRDQMQQQLQRNLNNNGRK